MSRDGTRIILNRDGACFFLGAFVGFVLGIAAVVLVEAIR